MDLVVVRPQGLYCPAGDFYIDPWDRVGRAVLTHAHADHARPGNGVCIAAAPGEQVLRQRLEGAALQLLPYGQPLAMGEVLLSLHPAGHVLGSAQVRIEHRGQVWVVSGDYKLEREPSCAPFETVRCDVFVTESTFALPIYRWPSQQAVFADINDWWRRNADAGRASVLFAYALGKAQRILCGVDSSTGPIVCHGAVERLNEAYRASGIALPPTLAVTDVDAASIKRALVMAPPSAQATPWLRRFGKYSDGFASGWMQLRGARRRRGVDRGFVLSDHADWPGLLNAIAATGASRVIVTHGYSAVLVRWLQQHGVQAEAFDTEYGDDKAERQDQDSQDSQDNQAQAEVPVQGERE